MELKKYLFIVFMFLALIGISSTSKAGYLEFNNISINALLKENGDMEVVEQWEIDIEDTNTLFKNWYLDTNKYSNITNVKVYEILENGSKKEFTKINEEMYHVTKDSYYALPISGGKFEVAFGVQVDNDVKKYEISYTVEDSVRQYEDCCEIYWQFIGSDNEIPAKNITGTITLQNAVIDKNNLRAWAHGPLNGAIEMVSNDTVKFNVNNLNTHTMLEVRIAVLERDIFNNLIVNNNKNLSGIIAEETILANNANRIREKNTKKIQIFVLIYIIISVLLIMFAVSKLKKALIAKKIYMKNKIVPNTKFDYFREIPDENASPAEALFIINHTINSNPNNNNGKILSATILNLCLKNKLEFEVDQTKKKDNIIFIIKDSMNIENLTEDEKIIFELLVSASDYKKDSEEIQTGIKKLTVKELEKYAENNAEDFIKDFNSITRTVKNILIQKEYYSKKIHKDANKILGYYVLYLVFGILALPFLILPGILMLITSGIYYKGYKSMNTLTQKGEDEKEKWKALKRYMEEFSLLKDREVPELVLWEKYLVYATVFGTADKVIKELKIIYPEITNSNDYMYMNLVYNTAFTTGFINTLNESVTKTYNAATATYYNSQNSSGSGYGGGFSRRRRRPAVVVGGCGGR